MAFSNAGPFSLTPLPPLGAPRMPQPAAAPQMPTPPVVGPPGIAGGPQAAQMSPLASMVTPYLGMGIADQLFQQLPPPPSLPGTPSMGQQSAVAKQQAPPATNQTTTPAAQSSTDTGATVSTSGNPAAFVQSLAPTAQAVSAQTGIPANILLAIAANETGWGSSMGGNNLMGIKGAGPAGSFNSPTWEVQNGQAVNTTGDFRAYNSPQQSMMDFANFLNQNPRYANAVQYLQQTGDGNGFIQMVNQAGYATDPSWASKIISIAQNTIPGLMPSGG